MKLIKMCILVPRNSSPVHLISIFSKGMHHYIVQLHHRLQMIRCSLQPEFDYHESNDTFKAIQQQQQQKKLKNL